MGISLKQPALMQVNVTVHPALNSHTAFFAAVEMKVVVQDHGIGFEAGACDLLQ